MAKLRVYQLARELNRDNAEIIRELQHMGVPVTSHSNTVEDRLADRLRRELGVFSPDGGKKSASAESDDIVAVEMPDEVEVTEVAEPATAEPEPPRVEAKAEPKPEPKVEEKAPEPKVAAPVQPAPPAPQPPPPAAEPPKVEQPAAAVHPPQAPQAPQPQPPQPQPP